MRGQDQSNSGSFGYAGLERRVPGKHRLWPIREIPDVTPQVAQNSYDTGRARRESAFGGRTNRHSGYAASQRVRERIGEMSGWLRTSAGPRRTKFRSLDGLRSQNAVDMSARGILCAFGRRGRTAV